MHFRGASAAEMAKMFGVSRNAVYRHLQYLGSKRAVPVALKWSSGEDALLTRLWPTSEALAIVVAHFENRGLNSVCARAWRLGLPPRQYAPQRANGRMHFNSGNLARLAALQPEGGSTCYRPGVDPRPEKYAIGPRVFQKEGRRRVNGGPAQAPA
jgi:hypothetical protein